MQLPPKPQLSRHRRARLVAWTLAMLLWLARALDAGARPTRRRIRQRYCFFDLNWLARQVARLIVLRAHEFARLRRRKRYVLVRFGRRLIPSGFLRSAIGGRLRRALKHRDAATRIAILIDALRRLDVFAVRFAARLQRKFTRFLPILPEPGATPALTAGAARPLHAADTS